MAQRSMENENRGTTVLTILSKSNCSNSKSKSYYERNSNDEEENEEPHKNRIRNKHKHKNKNKNKHKQLLEFEQQKCATTTSTTSISIAVNSLTSTSTLTSTLINCSTPTSITTSITSSNSINCSTPTTSTSIASTSTLKSTSTTTRKRKLHQIGQQQQEKEKEETSEDNRDIPRLGSKDYSDYSEHSHSHSHSHQQRQQPQHKQQQRRRRMIFPQVEKLEHERETETEREREREQSDMMDAHFLLQNLLAKEFTKKSDWDDVYEIINSFHSLPLSYYKYSRRSKAKSSRSMTNETTMSTRNTNTNTSTNTSTGMNTSMNMDKNIMTGIHSHSSDNKLSHYHLYLMLKQKLVPPPTQLIKTILNAYPELCDTSTQVYHLNVIIAFQNPSSSPEILYLLLSQSNHPTKLAYMIMQHIIDRGDNAISDQAMQVLIQDPFLEALYYHDSNGNLLLHQACLSCKSPRLVGLIIEGMLIDVGWWCVVGTNNDGLSPFRLVLLNQSSFISAHHKNAVFVQLLQVIPAQNLPAKECIVRNEILHICIRSGNPYLAFKILDAYPDLVYLWSSEGTLPIHDFCQYGTSESMETFLHLFRDKIQMQATVPTMLWTRFVPVQIACRNPNTTIFSILALLNLHNGVSYDQVVDQYGLLHLAAAASNITIARYLLATVPTSLEYRKFEYFGSWGTSGPIPLFFACVSGSSEMIEFLFKAGKSCHINHSNKHGGLIDSESGNDLHPILAACSNPYVTYDTMKMLLVESKITSPWICEWRLLHCAAFEGNMQVATALLEHCPEALYSVDDDGSLPLHDACAGGDPVMIEHLFFKQCKLSCTGGALVIQDNLCGMLDKNHLGVTPWDMICEMLESVFLDTDTDNDDILLSGLLSSTIVALILDAAMNDSIYNSSTTILTMETTLSILPSQLDELLYPTTKRIPFPVHHSAINLIPTVWLLENMIVQNYFICDPLHVDQNRRTALHLAAESQEMHENWNGIIYHLLHDDMNGSKHCACVRDINSRFPLHIAAEKGLCWNKGLRYIVEANEAALECKDEVTGLFPFMLAAAGKSNLDSIFQLLRKNPGTLTFPSVETTECNEMTYSARVM